MARFEPTPHGQHFPERKPLEHAGNTPELTPLSANELILIITERRALSASDIRRLYLAVEKPEIVDAVMRDDRIILKVNLQNPAENPADGSSREDILEDKLFNDGIIELRINPSQDTDIFPMISSIRKELERSSSYHYRDSNRSLSTAFDNLRFVFPDNILLKRDLIVEESKVAEDQTGAVLWGITAHGIRCTPEITIRYANFQKSDFSGGDFSGVHLMGDCCK